MNIDQALSYIHHVKWQGSKPGLSRTRELLSSLHNPEQQLKFIHIAGTNGKGSVAACLSAVLQEAGYTVGLYTSPYIHTFNERIQVNGKNISDAALCRRIEEIQPFADRMADAPTEFELITALAFLHFQKEACDIVILEAGMGGALDSTNVISTPEVSVLTSISLDHVKELGPTIADIARTKAGIIKPHGCAVCYGGEQTVNEVLRQAADRQQAELSFVDFDRLHMISADAGGCVFDFGGLQGIQLPLAGTYQPKNAALAITVLETLRQKGWPVSDRQIVRGLARVSWPGRFELLRRHPFFVLDGAHNPDGIRATAQSLSALFPRQKIIFLVGVMADKDVPRMMDCIAPLAGGFITVAPHNPRAMDASRLAELLSRYGKPVVPCDTIAQGVSSAFSLAGDLPVCALGSLYFSADVKNAVLEYGKHEKTAQ